MSESRIISRYNAYYHGWCLAFGEHKVSYEDNREINWLFSDDRIGLALGPKLRRRLYHELLGHHDKIPELILLDDSIRINQLIYPLSDEIDRHGMKAWKKFVLSGDDLHMFLCSHFCYPSGTRIVTFTKKKPTMIMYKEMQPMKLTIG